MCTHSVWKKRNVFLALLGAFKLEVLLLRLLPLWVVLAAATGVHTGDGCMLAFDRGVAGMTMPPAKPAASCHGLGLLDADGLDAATPGALIPGAFGPPACWEFEA